MLPIDRNIPLILLVSSIAILATAYGFEYIGGHIPCEICWWQRYIYMAAIPLALIATLTDRPSGGGPPRQLMIMLCFIFLVGAAVAGYHFGVEQKWWQGPTTCATTTIEDSIEDLIRSVMNAPIIRCDTPTWSLFGLSMTGYNFFLSLGLAILALRGAQGRR